MSRLQALGFLIASLACLAQLAIAGFVFVAYAYGYDVWPSLDVDTFIVTTIAAVLGVGGLALWQDYGL